MEIPEFVEFQLFKPPFYRTGELHLTDGGNARTIPIEQPEVNATIMIFVDSYSFGVDVYLPNDMNFITSYQNPTDTLRIIVRLINNVLTDEGKIEYPSELKNLYGYILNDGAVVHVNAVDILNSTAKKVIANYVGNYV